MSLIIPANSLAGGGYQIDNSLRYNSASSDNLVRTPASDGNRKTWTINYWIKRSKLTYNYDMNIGTSYSAGAGNSFQVLFDNTDRLSVQVGDGSFMLVSTQVFRDVSAWYAITISCDTSQATASNRLKVFVNGEQITSFATAIYPTLNLDTGWNKNIAQYVGDHNGSYSMNGYLSEVYNIDGQALTPTDFGEFDADSGVWKPIAYSGSYGTNGFFLEFQSSGALGTDSSGNANTFTVNNLTSIDQTTDTPTNNFATLNPLTASVASITYSEGNLALSTSTTWTATIATMASSLGKWYWEYKMGANTTMLGVSDVDRNINVTYNHQQSGTVFYYNNDGNKYVDGTASAYGATYTTNDIIGVALDLDSGTPTVTFYKNGTTQGTINLPSSMLGKSIVPIVELQSGIKYINFGNAPYTIASGNADANGYGNFEYAVPTGYLSLCTKNISEVNS